MFASHSFTELVMIVSTVVASIFLYGVLVHAIVP